MKVMAKYHNITVPVVYFTLFVKSAGGAATGGGGGRVRW